jgi:hypothetical protein
MIIRSSTTIADCCARSSRIRKQLAPGNPHLEHPERVLERTVGAVKPGGRVRMIPGLRTRKQRVAGIRRVLFSRLPVGVMHRLRKKEIRRDVPELRNKVMSDDSELTILMPCLNEAETLASCISQARAFLARSGCVGEVVIADNGSTDGSQAIAAANRTRVVHVTERGYGSALLGGIRAAHGKYVIMGDSDDSYDFSRLDAFVEQLRAGFQAVMGNRFRGGIAPGAIPALHRYLGNPGLTAIGLLFFGSGCGDFYCGVRGFDRQAILALDLQGAGHGIRARDAGQGGGPALYGDRSADHIVAGRPRSAAASAAMARWLAQFAVFPAVQSALAVPLFRV